MITIKLYSSLRNYAKTDKEGIVIIELDNESVKLIDLIHQLKIDTKEIGLATHNGKVINRMELLKESLDVEQGDYIELFSAMKGG